MMTDEEHSAPRPLTVTRASAARMLSGSACVDCPWLRTHAPYAPASHIAAQCNRITSGVVPVCHHDRGLHCAGAASLLLKEGCGNAVLAAGLTAGARAALLAVPGFDTFREAIAYHEKP